MTADGEGARLRRRQRAGWTKLPNAFLSDTRISIETRGMIAYIASCSDEWRFTSKNVATVCGVGRDKLQRMKGEARTVGYLTIVPVHSATGQIIGHEWVLDLEPDHQVPEKPEAGKTSLWESRPHKKDQWEEDQEKEPEPSARDLFQEDSTEEKRDSIPHRESRDSAREAFARFWAAYPKCKRKTDKPICAAVFANIVAGKAKGIPKTDPEVIIAGAEGYAASNPDPEYIKAPVGWLRGARWEQHLPAPAPDTSKPDELALIEAKAAASELRSNPPWIDRKSGKVEAQRERRWMGQVARVLIWEQKGYDPAAKDRDWWLKVDLTPRLDRLASYGLQSEARNGHPSLNGIRAPHGDGARV